MNGFKRCGPTRLLQCLSILLIACLNAAYSPAHAQIVWDGDAGDGEWDNPLNWNPDVVPGPTDDVIVDTTYSSPWNLYVTEMVTVRTFYIYTNCWVRGDGGIHATDAFRWRGAWFRGASLVSDGLLTIGDPAGDKNLVIDCAAGNACGTLVNNGEAILTPSTNNALQLSVDVVNADSATFTFRLSEESEKKRLFGGGQDWSFQNRGALIFESPAEFGWPLMLENYGVADLRDTRLIMLGSAAGFVNQEGGAVKGNGTVDGSQLNFNRDLFLTNHGTFAPGTSPGQIGVIGRYPHSSSKAMLDVEIAGAIAGVSHDALVVDGPVELAGRLRARSLADFEPTPGQRFMVLTATGGVTGTFEAVDAPGYSIEYNAGDVTLVAEPSVRLVYLVPADRTENANYTSALTRAAEHLQLWYQSQMGNSTTFYLNSPVVEVLNLPHSSAWFAANEVGDYPYWFWNNVIGDGFSVTGGGFNDPMNRWIYYIDADQACRIVDDVREEQIGGGGTQGVAVLPANDLRGLLGEPLVPICPGDHFLFTTCRFVGGLGHELGHALDLPHPPGCDTGDPACDYEALMWAGFYDYPEAYLRADDQSALEASPFFRPRAVGVEPFDCHFLLPNAKPYASATVDNVELIVGGADYTLDLTPLFFDANGDGLSFSATSSDEAIVQTAVTENVLTLVATGVGSATVEVAAEDGRGGSATVSFDVSVPTGVEVASAGPGVPDRFALGQNYPNPFSTATTIFYDLPQPSSVTLTVYDVLGRQVRELASGTRLAGRYEISFDVGGLPSGVYFYRLDAGGFVETKRMVVLK